MTDNDSAIAAKRQPLLPAGYGWGAAGVLAFSLTLPASRAALPAFGPVLTGLGRAVLVAPVAALCLLLARAPRPDGAQVRRLVAVAIGVVIGFPLCSSLALRETTAAHGAVLIGLLPAATAVVAVTRGRERPPATFWVAGALGAAAVGVFAATQGGAGIQASDAWLLAAVALGAVGYAEGGALARELGGWQVISWALLLALPVLLPVSTVGMAFRPPHAPDTGAWAGLAYVSGISMFGGFVAWYRGLALGGVARVAQVQLLQPVLTLGWSALLLGERVGPSTLVAAAGVVGAVALTMVSRRRAAEPAAPPTAAPPTAAPPTEPLPVAEMPA